MSVALYLVAIVAANLSVATFGPSVTVVNAFVFIGFDLTLRDRLHEQWEGRWLVPKMAALIAVGGQLSWLVNGAAGPIALASTVAFTLAAVADAVVYGLLGERARIVRINGSNVVSAAVDSLTFPTLAFGSFLPLIVLGQFAAKVAGGFVWSLILAVPLRRRPPDMPAMLTPRMGQRPSNGQPWAADNGRYASPQNYTDAKFLAWLGTMPADRCLFATAPDVVGDAVATLVLSAPMFARIRALGYRPALVAQDGLESLPVPWDEFDALFIGGTTAWKLGEAVRVLVAEARRRGKWVHMGRVNSLKRMRYAESIGCDSADGTVLKHDPNRPVDTWGPRVTSEGSLWRPA